MIRALGLALLFLTRIPVPVPPQPTPRDWGHSALFFPAVGLLIGLLLAGCSALATGVDAGVVAIVLLAIWTLLTGGLHLDGLADTADAWVGGHGDRDKTLAIMKDPRSGPIAIMAVVLVMLAKYAALEVVLGRNAWEVLLWAPVLGRGGMLLLMRTTPYARPGGLGSVYAEHLPTMACDGLLLVIGALLILHLGWDGGVLVLLLGLGLFLLRRGLMARLDGYTGDTLGATCELIEAVTLLYFALRMS